MTYSDALEYLLGIPRFSKSLSLERIRFLLSALGNPQNDLKFIHIAGTNGKGSVTTMLSKILISAGYNTGTYTSPYVEDFRERICVNGDYISKDSLARLTHRVAQLAKEMDDSPNAFEQITAIAIAYFKQCNCDIVCLETGLGGRWDATNIIPAPLISVITSIGLDHMQFLGDTHEKIALEKCGIIKPGSATVISPLQPDGVIDVISKNCLKKNVHFAVPNTKELEILSISLGGSDIKYNGKHYHIALQGRHQIYNALTVIDTAYSLMEIGYTISDKNIKTGISSAYLPARLELLSDDPLCLVDGAHNAPGVDALCNAIDALIPSKKLITVFGCLQDKSAEEMAGKLALRSSIFLCVYTDSPKACSPEELKAFATPFCKNIRTYSCLATALSDAVAASSDDSAILVCGSLYLAGPAKKLIKSLLNRSTDSQNP